MNRTHFLSALSSCILVGFFVFSSLLIATASPNKFKESISDPSEESTPSYDGRDFSIPQRILHSSAASASSISIAYPIYALKFDVQAGQPINLNPAHLYKGAGGYMIRTVPQSTVFLMSYKFFGGDDDASAAQQFLAGTASGLLLTGMAGPSELILTKERFQHISSEEVRKQIMERHGIKGFGQGLKATAAREIIYSLGLFAGPSALSMFIPGEEGSSLNNFAGAGAAGVFAGIVSAPLDTIRGHQQRLNLKKGEKAPSILQTAKTIYNEDGMQGLMKGATFRGMQMALSFVVIRTVRGLIQDHQAEENIKNAPQTPEPQTPEPQSILTGTRQDPRYQSLARQIQTLPGPTAPQEAQRILPATYIRPESIAKQIALAESRPRYSVSQFIIGRRAYSMQQSKITHLQYLKQQENQNTQKSHKN